MTQLLIDALAVYRITRLVTEDTITEPLRTRVFARWPIHDHPKGPAYVVTCPYCTSIYAALAVAATHTPRLKPFRPLVYALAIAAPTAILAERKSSSTGWS